MDAKGPVNGHKETRKWTQSGHIRFGSLYTGFTGRCRCMSRVGAGPWLVKEWAADGPKVATFGSEVYFGACVLGPKLVR